MLVREIKKFAQQWVEDEARKTPNFFGAYHAGSINWMDDDDPFPPTSDVDINIVREDYTEGRGDFKKILYHDIVIEIHHVSSARFKTPEDILGTYHLAAHFTQPNIILDTTGELTRIQSVVAKEFAKQSWVRKRVQGAHEWAMKSSEFIANWGQHHEAYTWLYPITIIPHVFLVADLKNPTVRKCLIAGRDVLVRYGQLEVHEAILDVLGSSHMKQEQVEAHLAACAELYDATTDIISTPFFGSSSLSKDSRAIAIGGSREIIDMGFHREAMFWIATIHIWCQTALKNDVPPETQKKYVPMFDQLLRDLGVFLPADRQQRIDQIKRLGPRLMETAEAIMADNPLIVN